MLPLDADRFAIMVADVSGHGAPAAIVMAMIRAVLHTYPGLPDDPPAVLHHINRHFRYLWNTPMYATAVFAVLDVGRRTIRTCSAGHPPPLLSRAQHAAPLPVENAIALLFGDLGDVRCAEQTLRQGDRILFYTDGVTDRRAPDDSMFDWECLAAALAKLDALEAAAIVEHLIAQLDAFASGVEPDDDQTLLLVGIE